jgi:hypothetical protein
MRFLLFATVYITVSAFLLGQMSSDPNSTSKSTQQISTLKSLSPIHLDLISQTISAEEFFFFQLCTFITLRFRYILAHVHFVQRDNYGFG